MTEHLIQNQTVRDNLLAAYNAQNFPLAYTIVLDYMETTPDPIFTPALKFWFQARFKLTVMPARRLASSSARIRKSPLSSWVIREAMPRCRTCRTSSQQR
jgi:hypothetical protein